MDIEENKQKAKRFFVVSGKVIKGLSRKSLAGAKVLWRKTSRLATSLWNRRDEGAQKLQEGAQKLQEIAQNVRESAPQKLEQLKSKKSTMKLRNYIEYDTEQLKETPVWRHISRYGSQLFITPEEAARAGLEGMPTMDAYGLKYGEINEYICGKANDYLNKKNFWHNNSMLAVISFVSVVAALAFLSSMFETMGISVANTILAVAVLGALTYFALPRLLVVQKTPDDDVIELYISLVVNYNNYLDHRKWLRENREHNKNVNLRRIHINNLLRQ